MVDRRRLGKGLGALIPEVSDVESAIKEVALAQVQPNPYQPRKVFDEAKLQELANSIKEHGVVQAIVVSPSSSGYFLVAGERRFRAAQMAGLETIPAVVREFKAHAMLEIALIENLQREDLNPMEEAAAYHQLMEEFNLTQEEMAKRIGKSRPAIANTLRLLALPPAIREAIVRGEITPGRARPLLAIQDAGLQEKMGRYIAKKGLSAREAERLVNKTLQEDGQTAREGDPQERDPYKADLQERLQRHLGTKVSLIKAKGGGHIQIHYYGDEDLNRLLFLIMPGGID